MNNNNIFNNDSKLGIIQEEKMTDKFPNKQMFKTIPLNNNKKLFENNNNKYLKLCF